jgi:hypothetical protein
VGAHRRRNDGRGAGSCDGEVGGVPCDAVRDRSGGPGVPVSGWSGPASKAR